MRPATRKTSDHVTTPPGTANTIQGVAVLGYGHAEAAAHPTLTYVIR